MVVTPNGFRYKGTIEEGIDGDGIYNGTLIPPEKKLEPTNWGIGSAFYPDNSRYNGTFLDGMREGYGEYTDHQDGLYKGFWHGDKKHGEGFYMDRNGALLRQRWENGVLKHDLKLRVD